MTSPKILYYDIEISLQTVAIFDLKYNDYISPESLVSERHLICAAWKWEGENKVHAVSLLDDSKRYAKDAHDDYHVVKALHGVLSEADVVIGHNSESFDNKYVETRGIYHGLSPLPALTSIDTYKVAKSRFRFNSNKLDYLGRYLGVGRKKPTTPGLWMRVLQGDRKAIKEMVAYNKQDVLLLERVFLKLRPYVNNHANLELFGNTGCPRCGSKKVQSRGFHRAVSRVYRRFQCQSCGGWHKSAVNEKAVKPQFRVI